MYPKCETGGLQKIKLPIPARVNDLETLAHGI
jgi:hypothetical protein